MAATPPSTAQLEHFHILLTLWPTREHRILGGNVFRAATGVLTRTGGVISVVDDAGVSHLYPPGLDPSTALQTFFSTAPQSITVSILWPKDSQTPIDVNMRYAEAELCMIDEASGGTAVTTWAKRGRRIRGPITQVTWGDSLQQVTITIGGEAIVDSGDFYRRGAEFSSDMFPDMANTTDRDRANKSIGQLPALCWAPVGSAIHVPCMVIQDEDDAANGVSNLVPRRHLMSRYRPTNTSAVEQFEMPDPAHEKRMLLKGSAIYQRVPQQGTDSLGEEYWYVLGGFTHTYGSGTTVTFTNASAAVTATKTGRFLAVGWQTRYHGDNDDEWQVVLSKDGSSIQLGDSAGAEQTYDGAGGSGTGDSIPLPASKCDSLFWIPALGGIPARDGTPISNVIDVLCDWLSRFASLNVPVDIGSLRAMRTKLRGLDLSYVRRTRGSPWAQCLEVLSYLPIRPYLQDGVLRFRWTGIVNRQEIRATIDLDSLGPAYRMEPMTWADDPVYPIVQVQCWWDVFEQKFTSSFALDGSTRSWTDTQRLPVGRARQAFAAWRDVLGVRTAARCPTMDVKIDTIELKPAARLAALWLLYRWGVHRPRFRLPVEQSMRWLDVGDVIQVTQTGTTYASQMWRVEGTKWSPSGDGELLLEGVVS